VGWTRLLYRRARRQPVLVLLGTLVLLLAVGLVLAMNWTPAPIVLPAQPVPVAITTLPDRAEMHFIPRHPRTGEYQPEKRIQAPGKSPVQVDLLPGDYLVVAILDDGRFHEVLRHVPDLKLEGLPTAGLHNEWTMKNGVAHLNRIKIPSLTVTEGMCKLPGMKEFLMGQGGSTEIPLHRRSVPAFYLDCNEFTVADATRNHPIDILPDELRQNPPLGNIPLTFVSWERTVYLAEIFGKRLPDEVEYEYAATLGGTRSFPWGNDANALKEWPIGPVGNSPLDRLEIPGQPPVFGRYSNVAEWTASWGVPYPSNQGMPDPLSEHRVIRGGPYSVVLGAPRVEEWQRGPRQRLFQHKNHFHPGLGFRCARSVKPRLQPEDFVRRLPSAKQVQAAK
jgi:formylglycine-generating enzyme required for sulfatase activity